MPQNAIFVEEKKEKKKTKKQSAGSLPNIEAKGPGEVKKKKKKWPNKMSVI